jgi:hypothetical protein
MRRRQAGQILDVLDQERDARERPDIVAGRHSCVQAGSLGEGVLGPERHDGADPRIQPLDPLERERHQLPGRDLSCVHGASDRDEHRSMSTAYGATPPLGSA